MFASFCFFGDSNKTVLQTQSQKTSELDNDEWGTDVSGPSEWQLPPPHMGSMTWGEGHCSTLQATQSRPCHQRRAPRACGTHGESSPNGWGSWGLNSLGNDSEPLQEGQALSSKQGPAQLSVSSLFSRPQGRGRGSAFRGTAASSTVLCHGCSLTFLRHFIPLPENLTVGQDRSGYDRWVMARAASSSRLPAPLSLCSPQITTPSSAHHAMGSCCHWWPGGHQSEA